MKKLLLTVMLFISIASYSQNDSNRPPFYLWYYVAPHSNAKGYGVWGDKASVKKTDTSFVITGDTLELVKYMLKLLIQYDDSRENPYKENIKQYDFEYKALSFYNTLPDFQQLKISDAENEFMEAAKNLGYKLKQKQ
jgi:hypothetical protein